MDGLLAFQLLPMPIGGVLKSIMAFLSHLFFRQSFDVAVLSFEDVADSKSVMFLLVMNDATVLRVNLTVSVKASLLAVAEFPLKP